MRRRQPPLSRQMDLRKRVIARKDGPRVRLYSRPGNDLTQRFPLIVEALARLCSLSCTIDGEAVACGDDGVSSFDHIRYRRNDGSVFLYAFDLIELNGDDLRRDPLEVRKATLASILKKAAPGLRFNEHLVEHPDGITVFQHACIKCNSLKAKGEHDDRNHKRTQSNDTQRVHRVREGASRGNTF